MSQLLNPDSFYDDRSFEQQMADLGVDVIRKKSNTVTGVKWVRKNAYKTKPALTVGARRIYFNVAATKMLNLSSKRYDFGAGDYQEQRVILLFENDHGYKITIATKGNCVTAVSSTSGLIRQLADVKIKPGRYILHKIKGGYMGVPEK